MRAVFLAIPAALLMTTTARAQESAPAAAEALQTFSKLVTEENAERMGFGAPAEMQYAELGVPAMEFFVRLDTLKRYTEGQDPRKLLTGGDKAVYPVLVNGAPRSSIELVKGRGGWRAVSFGAPNLGRRLSLIRAEKAAQLHVSPSVFAIIRVPALSLYFLGHDEGGELFLTPIMDDARFPYFNVGESRPAREVFRIILPTARETPDHLPG